MAEVTGPDGSQVGYSYGGQNVAGGWGGDGGSVQLPPGVSAYFGGGSGVQGGAVSPADFARLLSTVTQRGAPVNNVGGGGAPAAFGPGLNIPYGADYLDPTLKFLLGVLGLNGDQASRGLQAQQIANQDRQYYSGLEQRNNEGISDRLLSASQILASMQANPRSAAQLAFQRGGLGLNPFGDNGLDASQLATFSTRGNAGHDLVDFGPGTVANVAHALNLHQLKQLQGNPNGQGVLESFATAGGNGDIIKRSIASLIPTGFGGVGAG